MKHCILVKWNDPKEMKNRYPDIKAIFNRCKEIEGISDVEYKENFIDRKNRYDFLIVITMEEEALPVYDVSDMHIQWKEEYGKEIEKKAIFDYEDERGI